MRIKVMVPIVFALGAALIANTALAQQVAKDPDDSSVDQRGNGRGKLRAPSREETDALLKAMAPSLSQSSEGLVFRQLPGGAVGVDLEGRFESIALARVTADGKVATECVTNEAEARDFLNRDMSDAASPGPEWADVTTHAHDAAELAAMGHSTAAVAKMPALEER